MKNKIIKVSQIVSKPIILDTPGGYTIELLKPKIETTIIVRTKIEGEQQAEYRIVVKHLASATKSKTVLKGVVDGQAKLRFFGKIIVAHNCQQVEAFLEERVILLSDRAKAEVVPELEILNDEVICSHAATISYPDEEQIFYLMSRGVSRSQAVQLLVEGFLS